MLLNKKSKYKIILCVPLAEPDFIALDVFSEGYWGKVEAPVLIT